MTLWCDDLVEGRRWSSPGRTITESDVAGFAGLTRDQATPSAANHPTTRSEQS